MNLFKELGEALRPEEFSTITAYLSNGKEVHHTFIKGTGTKEIQLFLTNLYGSDCWSWI